MDSSATDFKEPENWLSAIQHEQTEIVRAKIKSQEKGHKLMTFYVILKAKGHKFLAEMLFFY